MGHVEVGVGWGVMQGGVGCVIKGWGGSCRGVVGVGGWVIHVEEFTFNFL